MSVLLNTIAAQRGTECERERQNDVKGEWLGKMRTNVYS